MTMTGQAGRPSSHCPAQPCSTLSMSCFVCLLEFNVEEIMHKSFESILRAMRRDQPKTPEPIRSTLPITDQPRIPQRSGVSSHLTTFWYLLHGKPRSFSKLVSREDGFLPFSANVHEWSTFEAPAAHYPTKKTQL